MKIVFRKQNKKTLGVFVGSAYYNRRNLKGSN